MPEVLATPAKPRLLPTEGVACMGGLLEVQQHLRAAKRLPRRRASEWHQDSRKGSWLAFIAGLRVVDGKPSLGLLRPVKEESDGNGWH